MPQPPFEIAKAAAGWAREHAVAEATAGSLCGHAATGNTGEAKDACAKEGQGCGLGYCGWVRKADEALLVNRSAVLLVVSIGSGWRRDPVDVSDQAARDLAGGLESVQIGSLVGDDTALTGRGDGKFVAVFHFPDSCLQALALRGVGHSDVEKQPGNVCGIVHRASIDDAVGGEGGVVVGGVGVDAVIEIDAVDCGEIDRFAADDSRRTGHISSGCVLVVPVEGE